MEIPELAEEYIRRVSIHKRSVQDEARAIRLAKGRERTSVHPLLKWHRFRLMLTDRLHQSTKKKTHKRPSCQQHLACIVSTLSDDRTTIMESLNSRLKDRLRTLCTLTPKRAMLFYHRLTYWENKSIITRQRKSFNDARLPGHRVVEPEPFGIAVYICEGCSEYICKCPVARQ